MLSKNWLISKLDVVESTQDLARDLTLNGQQVAIVAKNQTKGYGQHKRPWQATEGNLNLSIAFNSNSPTTQVTYVACVALGKVLESFKKDLEMQYKWVNDILVCGKKVSGILTEQHGNKLIIGVAVNIKNHPDTSSTSAVGATDLSEHGIKTTAEEFMNKFLESFTDTYNEWLSEGFNLIRNQWKTKAYKLNENVSIDGISGIFYDIDSNDGSLILQNQDKQLIKIQTGSLR
jgi:BirA family biotin operon repressor/biotin-[acetyl-CoA-carboxylase] ligase